MKYILFLLLLSPCLFASGQAHYNPSYTPLFTVASKPYAISQGAPVDGRSYKADSVNFLWRPYNGTNEVLSYLNTSTYRTGQFPIEVNVGGSLNSNGTFTGGYIYEYWFRGGTADTCLVLKSFFPPNLAGFLLAANNLSDVQSTSTSRSNLGLGAMATQGTTASSTDLMGTWPGSLVVESIQGHNLAYLLNYNNLTNTPTIPAQFNPIQGTNMSITGTYPNITFSANLVSVFSQARTAFVDSLGNDATGIVGNPNLPFATINAAIVALGNPNVPAIISLGVGTYNAPDSTHMRGNIWYSGSGCPQPNWIVSAYNSDSVGYSRPTKLIGGTIIDSTLAFEKNSRVYGNIMVTNLGIDVGKDWVTNKNSGGVADGLVFGQFYANGGGQSGHDGIHPLQSQSPPIYGVYVNNVISLGDTNTSVTHGMLFENLINPFVSNITSIYGIYGVVIKSIGGKFSHIVSQSHSSTGLYFKSDDYANCNSVTVTEYSTNDILFGETAYGILLGGEEFPLRNIVVSNFILNRPSIGIAQDGGLDTVESVQINNGVIHKPSNYGLIFYNSGAGPVMNCSFNQILIDSSRNEGVVCQTGTGVTYDNDYLNNIAVVGAINQGFNLSATKFLFANNLMASNCGGVDFQLGSNVVGEGNQALDNTISGNFTSNNIALSSPVDMPDLIFGQTGGFIGGYTNHTYATRNGILQFNNGSDVELVAENTNSLYLLSRNDSIKFASSETGPAFGYFKPSGLFGLNNGSLINGGLTLFGAATGASTDSIVTVLNGAIRKVASTAFASIAGGGDVSAASGSSSGIATATAPSSGSAHSYTVSGYVTVTAITAGTVQMSASYTDETNTVRTLNFGASITGTGPNNYSATEIRVKSGTSISISTATTGTVTYDGGATITFLR